MSKSLVIVESPAKAKTIEKYLGAGFEVLASVGHIMDLPKNELGVELENRTFEPTLIVSPGKEKVVAALKRAALEQGFELVGVAEAGPAASAGALRAWLETGMHGGMEYLRTTAELRADPRRLLSGCRSVVVVAMSYHTSLPASSAPAAPDTVWVSRYAWGRDYHRILKGRLLRLGRWLQGETGSTALGRYTMTSNACSHQTWSC